MYVVVQRRPPTSYVTFTEVPASLGRDVRLSWREKNRNVVNKIRRSDLKDEIIEKEKELTKEHKERLGIYENCTAQDYQIEELRDYVEDDIERWFQDAVWKRISLDCILAFMITCGAPVFRVYNPVTCNISLTGQHVRIS
uniref:Putative salivary lipocalin n=1 Tax=Ixodes ricinus TaxID=34613 RepID=A0A0K8RBD9_IXORI